MDTGLRRYDASYYKPPLVMLGYDTPRQGDFFLQRAIDTLLNKGLVCKTR